jgi:ribosomal protein S18 acetylase RimI-like enzyme
MTDQIAASQISIQGPSLGTAGRCEPVLRALPQWFGIESANQHYLEAIQRFPTFLAHRSGTVIGFLTTRQHFPQSAEIYVTGVLPAFHRQGVGRALLQAAESHLSQQGVAYLQVKTLSASHPDAGYARTRAFYQAMGFQPLEEIKTLWDDANPALILIKKL